MTILDYVCVWYRVCRPRLIGLFGEQETLVCISYILSLLFGNFLHIKESPASADKLVHYPFGGTGDTCVICVYIYCHLWEQEALVWI